jgi:hypothetical protein
MGDILLDLKLCSKVLTKTLEVLVDKSVISQGVMRLKTESIFFWFAKFILPWKPNP